MAALDTFYDAIAEPEDLAFHLQQNASFTFDGDQIPSAVALYRLDVDGHAGSGDVLAGAGGQNLRFDIVFIDEDAWLRPEGGDWIKADPGTVDTADLWDIWQYLPAQSDVELDSIGRTLIHYESTKAIPYQTASMRASGADGSITHTQIYLLPDGTPHRILWTIEATGVLGGEPRAMTGDSEILITNWGDPVTIEPPVD